MGLRSTPITCPNQRDSTEPKESHYLCRRKLVGCQTIESKQPESNIMMSTLVLPKSIAQIPVPVPTSRTRCGDFPMGAAKSFRSVMVNDNSCNISNRSCSSSSLGSMYSGGDNKVSVSNRMYMESKETHCHHGIRGMFCHFRLDN